MEDLRFLPMWFRQRSGVAQVSSSRLMNLDVANPALRGCMRHERHIKQGWLADGPQSTVWSTTAWFLFRPVCPLSLFIRARKTVDHQLSGPTKAKVITGDSLYSRSLHFVSNKAIQHIFVDTGVCFGYRIDSSLIVGQLNQKRASV